MAMNGEEKAPRSSSARIAQILLIILLAVALLMTAITIGAYTYCHTVAFCDPRPTMSPRQIATLIPMQYDAALKDIGAGRYRAAQQRLEYILYHDPDYPGAAEKLREIEVILAGTGTP